MRARVLAAAGVVLVVVLMASAYVVLVSSWSVPPPDSPPGDTVAPFVTDNVTLSATASFGQDFMPFYPPEGPPLSVYLQVSIGNTGPFSLGNFSIPKTTIYYGDTKTPLVTLALVLLEPDEFMVDAGGTVTFRLHNDWESVFSPDLSQGTLLYARVLIVWMDGSTTILTSPESGLQFTW